MYVFVSEVFCIFFVLVVGRLRYCVHVVTGPAHHELLHGGTNLPILESQNAAPVSIWLWPVRTYKELILTTTFL